MIPLPAILSCATLHPNPALPPDLASAVAVPVVVRVGRRWWRR